MQGRSHPPSLQPLFRVATSSQRILQEETEGTEAFALSLEGDCKSPLRGQSAFRNQRLRCGGSDVAYNLH